MLRNLGLGASLAVTTAQAFILPAISVEGDSLNAMALAGVDPFKQIVKADCRGCLFAQRTESEAGPGISWTDDVDNALLAKFTVSDDLRKLSFNDIEVYPATFIDISSPLVTPQPVIVQVPTDATASDIYNATRVDEIASPPLKLTGWGWSSQGKPTEDGKELLLTIRVTIGAIEGQGVDVPEITVELLKNQNEELLLLRAETETTDDAPAPESKTKAECTSSRLLCQWRETIASTFSALRTKIHGLGAHAHKKPGCKGKGKGMAGGHHRINGPGHNWHPHSPPAHAPHVNEDWGFEARPHHRPGGWEHKDGEFKHHGGHHGHHGPPDGMHHGPHGHGHGHHGHHGHRHGFGRVMHFITDIATHVIAPMLIGLVIGVLLVFVGWSIAVLASIFVAWRAGEAFCWDHYAPRWRSGYAIVDEDDSEEAAYVDDEEFIDVEKLDEKSGLLGVQEEGEAPPVYIEVESREQK